MNLKAIRDEVLANGFDPVRMSGRIDQYINDAQFEIARRVNYYSEEVQASITTTPAVAMIPFPTDLAKLRTVRNLDTNQPLTSVGLGEIDMSSAQQGQPLYWAIDGPNIHLYPTPDSVITLAIRYWKLPTTLTLDADVPSIPIDYHNMLITYACYRCYFAEDDEQTGQVYEKEWEQQLARFHTDVVFPTTDEPHQARGMWDPPTALPGGNAWTIFG